MFYGGGAQYFPEYQLNLGAAVTPLQSNVSGYLWDGVYRRDFQNGFVLVNPGSTAYTLNLGGTYQEVQGHGGGTLTDSQLDANGNYIGGTLTYQDLSSITLAGGTAAIFLNPTSGPLTVATPAAAAANPVTGTTVGLSVLGQEGGSDAGLTYTWSSSGPAAVTFSANGSNGAKNVTAAFTRAGSYTFTATITDGNNQSVTSVVVVAVNQTLTSITVAPATASVADGATRQFTATAADQFGQALSNPSVAWSLSGLDALGLRPVHRPGRRLGRRHGHGDQRLRPCVGDGKRGGRRRRHVRFKRYDGSGRLAVGLRGTRLQRHRRLQLPLLRSGERQRPVQLGMGRLDHGRPALSNPAGGRIAACWYSAGSFSVGVNLTDGQTHQVSLYFLDWDKAGRSETVGVYDTATGALLDSRTVSSFSGGEYLVWDVSGNVTFKITKVAGVNAVLSGIFFGGMTSSSNSASYVKSDAADQGSWQGVYGAAADVAGVASKVPSYAQVSLIGQSNYVWAASTPTPPLQNPAGGRIASCSGIPPPASAWTSTSPTARRTRCPCTSWTGTRPAAARPSASTTRPRGAPGQPHGVVVLRRRVPGLGRVRQRDLQDRQVAGATPSSAVSSSTARRPRPCPPTSTLPPETPRSY